MPIRCLLLAGVVAAALVPACQGSATHNPPTKRAAEVLVTTGGRTSARVVATRPCRATIDGSELMVGTDPLVVQVGSVRWTGEVGPNGTSIRRDDTIVARVYSPHPGSLAAFDPAGVALFRAEVSGDTATIAGADGAVKQVAKRVETGGISVGDAMVSGTNDLTLAALLTATAVDPEVRGLAACQRLVQEGTL